MNSETILTTEADLAQSPHLTTEAQCVWEIRAGNQRVVQLQTALTELATQCGQAHFIEQIEYFLSNPYPGSHQPAGIFQHLGMQSERLVQRSKRPVLALQWYGTRLKAAVLLHEYCFYGIPTTLYVSADPDGWRTVIAPGDQRLVVANRCSELLISRGATLVFVSFTEGEGAPEEVSSAKQGSSAVSVGAGLGILLASQRRSLRQRLRLLADYDSTLATMGARTRRNLRAAARSVKNELGCEYHAKASVTEQEFVESYRRSTHPIPDWVARWRYASIQTVPGAFLAGIRNSDGTWLGLLGGRRSGETTFIDWQVNADYKGPLSLGTALRALLIEDEHQGQIRLVHFEGGTSHTMSHAFLDDGATDLLFGRPGLPQGLLKLFARFFPPGGLLAQAILGSEVEWTQ